MQITLNLGNLGTFEIEDDVHNEFERLRIVMRELFKQFLNNIISNLAFVKSKKFTDESTVIVDHGFGTEDVDAALTINDNGTKTIDIAGSVEIVDEDTISVDLGDQEYSGKVTVFGKIDEAQIKVT